MPYNEQYEEVKPRVALSYRGLTVFCAYERWGDIRNEAWYFYRLSPQNDPSPSARGWLFDIRDLTAVVGLNLMDRRIHALALKQAIEAKELPPKEWLGTVGWEFKLGKR